MKRFAAGEQGAFSVADRNNKKWVLKWQAGQNSTAKLDRAALFTNRLKELGYPVPTYLFTGATPAGVYSIQEELPGEGSLAFPPDQLETVLRLNDLQRGRAAELGVAPTEWPARVVQSVLVGGEGYCLLDTMRNDSPATAGLLDSLQRIVLKLEARNFPAGDIVHFDFSPINILLEGGRVSGVIDWQDPCAGDCTFDLVTLLFYSYEPEDLRGKLWEAVLARSSREIVAVYLAHLILRQVEWSVRHHDRATVRRWLTLTGQILGDLAALLPGYISPN